MAKQRIIHTTFWSDPFIQELSPLERYFYLYLLTNEHTEINGVYEITLKTMSSDTDIPRDRLLQFVDRLRQSGKVEYIDNYVILFNFSKHQKSNPSIQEGIQKANSKLPDKIKEIIQTPPRLSPVSPQPGTLKPELESKLKPELELELESESLPTPAQNAKEFFFMVLEHNEKYAEFCFKICETKNIPLPIVQSELQKFMLYWTELSNNGKKQRWQLQKVFEVQKRLASWFSKLNTFQNPKPSNATIIS